jgi:hypothetical protein
MNQPAFPQNNDRIVASLSIAHSQGMTLRDYFAAKAMHALLTHSLNNHQFRFDANDAFKVADFMLKAREAT